MSCLQQTGSGDLALTLVNGGKRLTVLTDIGLCAAQKLTNRFLFFLGEWFLDTRQGLPYYQVIAVKNPNLAVLTQLFTKVVLGVPDIVSINNLTLTLNAARQATLALSANLTTGQTVSSGPGNAFIVTPGSGSTS